MATRTFETAFKAGSVQAVRVLGFREVVRLGRPGEAWVTVQLDDYVDPEKLVGQGAVLVFASGSSPQHAFAGIVESVTVVGSPFVGGTAVHHYRFHVVSRMALLARSIGSEIHQDLDVKEIVTKVLVAQGIGEGAQKWQLAGSYPKRTYCVQYQESALAFVSRLLEEEGIFWHAEVGDSGDEQIVFQDDSSAAPPIDGDEKVRFRPRTGLDVDEDAIVAIVEGKRTRSGKFTLRDYDFERPKLDLTKSAAADAETDLEIYDYPGRYFDPALGERLAKVRLEAEQVERDTLEIEADLTRLVPGRMLTITEALHDELNARWFVTGVVHELAAAKGAKDPVYVARATLIPEFVKFRTPQTTPWPVIDGPQTAVVVAPKGAQPEEIHTDQHGRVKVKFHWDLGPDQDDKASCWMRVTQLQTSGSMVLPRVDWEVVVEFLEGNPDRPIVTGRLYNGIYMPPYALPEGRTRTAIRTSTTPGGGGANEIRFEDKAGAEEIMIYAQYDQNVVVANNKTKTVGNCETHDVAVDAATKVGANQTVKVTKGDQVTIGADQTVSVGGNRTVEVNAVTGLNVGGNASTSVGGNHFEMDGNPLQALLALAAQKAAEVATAKAGEALAAVDAAVRSRLDQAMGPVKALEQKAEQLGGAMRSIADGNLGAAPGLVAAAAGLPAPGAFASSLGGGGGGEATRGGGGGGAGGGGPSAPGITAELAIDQAVHRAIQRGVTSAADALGEALGIDAAGGGGASGDNVGGPAGDVPGIDAEDRAKGPGHATSKIGGSLEESIGSMKVTAALQGIMTNVAGNLTQNIGAARIEMVLGNRAEEIGANKDESALGLVVVTKGDETEQVAGSKTSLVGGAILEKIAGGHAIEAGAPATFIGAFHKLEAASKITLKCGASEVVIDGGGVAFVTPLVVITAGKIALTKAVSEV